MGRFAHTGGTCLIAGCDAPGMDDFCTEGRACESVFGGSYCVAQCVPPAPDCEGAENCQGPAVGCRPDFACHATRDDAATGVCLLSCSAQPWVSPDDFCRELPGEPLVTCDLDTGTCME